MEGQYQHRANAVNCIGQATVGDDPGRHGCATAIADGNISSRTGQLAQERVVGAWDSGASTCKEPRAGGRPYASRADDHRRGGRGVLYTVRHAGAFSNYGHQGGDDGQRSIDTRRRPSYRRYLPTQRRRRLFERWDRFASLCRVER